MDLLSNSKPKLYTAWSCPFAQRAWIAFLYKGIDFEYIEQDPYNKTPEWLGINPRGLVPAIVHNGNTITESSVCIEYVDEAWPVEGKSLMPLDPYRRALVRIWSDQISKKIVPGLYGALQKRNPQDQERCLSDILDCLRKMSEAMSPEGHFFLGQEFGKVDVMLAPFACRFYNGLKHYRRFVIPDDAGYSRYHTWWNAVKELECVKTTLPNDEKMIELYKPYADNVAKSEVAVAIRGGGTLP